MYAKLDRPAPDGDLPSTLAFTLLFLLPAGLAFATFELVRALPGHFPDSVVAFLGLLLAPAVVTAVVSRWACTRFRVETGTAWSTIAAASLLAAVCSVVALLVFAVGLVAYSD